MLRHTILFLLLVISLDFVTPTYAGQTHTIPLLLSATRTFYIEARLGELTSNKFMLDTGSGYTTINKSSFDDLQKNHQIRFIRKVLGVLADGGQREIEIWEIDSLTLNGVCTLKNIQVALMPGTNRQILGLTTLVKVAPFTLSLDPPSLVVSNCA